MTAPSATPPPRVFAVVPAAGRSVRMGRPKLLLPCDDAGRTIIETVLAAWRAGGVTQVVVTVHPDDTELANVCRAARADVALPAIPPPDMKASIDAAAKHIAERFAPLGGDLCMMAPADLPRLAPAVISRLIAAHDPQRPTILRPVHEGRGGHPLLLPWPVVSWIKQIPNDRGLDYLIESRGCRDVETGLACLAADVDTPDDYRRLRDG